MEDTEPSRLRGAYENYLKSKDYFRQNVPRNTRKCVTESCCCYIIIFILFCSMALFGSALISYYSKDYFSLFRKLKVAFLVSLVFLVLFVLIFILKFDPCHPTASDNAAEEQTANQLDAQHTSEERIAYQPAVLHHRFFGLSCLRSCCPTVSTGHRQNQTEEYTAYHPAVLHNETDEQTANQSAAQHEADEEGIVYRPAVLRHRFFRLGRIFCCPRRCYPTVSTEDLRNKTEEYATCQVAAQNDATEDQTINQLDRIPVQTVAEVLQPYTSQETSEEVSAKLQIVEEQLLQYFLGEH